MLWDSDQYWLKALRYVELAAQVERENWERPFWLSLSMEFLARAVLTKIHPALNADPEGDGVNLLYAFGYVVKGQPKSLPIHAVLLRLQKVYPDDFTEPRRKFCDFFANVRNQELHTSELAFDGLKESQWLARYYDVCQVLCEKMGKALDDMFDEEEAAAARKLVGVLGDEKTSSVKAKIASHRKVFDAKESSERVILVKQQELISMTWHGILRSTICPACGSKAKLVGSVERVSKPMYDDDQFFQKNVVLADRLECGACGLRLTDIEELHVAEIEPHFEYFSATELHEYHEPDDGPEYDNM